MSFLGRAIGAFVILFAYTGLAADTEPASSPNSDGSQVYDVRRFLEEAPPLIKIVYGEDPSSYGINGKSISNFVYHEASWQPPSFCVENLTNSLDLPSSSRLYRRVVGRSLDNTPWVLDRSGQLKILWLTTEDNNDPERAVAVQAVNDALLRLQRARGLWVHLLRPGSLRWVDKSHFEAEADVPPRVIMPHGTNCTLSGRIVAWDKKGRPTRIEYNCFGFPTLGDMSLDFYYKTPVGTTELPSVIVSEMDLFTKSGKHSKVTTTNLLKDVKIGTDRRMGSNGYVAGLFLSSNTPPQVVIASNGVDYRVDGPVWRPLIASPPLKVTELKPRQLVFARCFFAIVIIISVPVFLFSLPKKKGLK